MTTVDGLRGVGLDTLRIEGREVTAELGHIDAAEVSRRIDEASTLTVVVADPHRTLLRSQLLDQESVAHVDGLVFTLEEIAKTASTLQLLFRDSAAVDLAKRKGSLTQEPGTSTRGAFLRRLATESPLVVEALVEEGSTALRRLGRGDLDPEESSWEATGRIAEEVAWRRFVAGNRFYAGSDQWLIDTLGPAIPVAEHTGGVDDVDWTFTPSLGEETATLACDAARWAAPPGTPVDLQDMGHASGIWLVAGITRSLFSTATTVDLVRRVEALPEPPQEPDPEFDPGDLTVGPQISGGGRASPDFVAVAMSRDGAPYVWGATGPSKFDCSGLVQWSLGQVGVRIPRTSKTQYAHCRDSGTLISVSDAVGTYGALLFRIAKTGISHVAISTGDGRTIEARGRNYGVGRWSATAGRSWTAAGLVPGVTYR